MSVYRELSLEERLAFFASNPDLVLVPNIPTYGLCVGWDNKSILVFKMQSGEIRLVDVGDKCLAHFGQRFPAPEGMMDTVLRYLDDLRKSFGKWALALFVLACLLGVVWAWAKVEGAR